MKKNLLIVPVVFFALSCTKTNNISQNNSNNLQQQLAANFYFVSMQIGNQTGVYNYYHISINPVIKLKFSRKIDKATVPANIALKENTTNIAINYSYENGDSTVVISPQSPLKYITKYAVNIYSNLQSTKGNLLGVNYSYNQVTTIDSSDKFKRIPDNKLLTLVQKQTFNFFWINANPISGLAHERNTSGDVCAIGGTGFGIMSIPVAIERGFITKVDGLARMLKIVNFLDANVTKYHGAFAHWVNGTSGATIPFSPHDDGADLVETSYLMEGLLTARQYFNGSSTDETNLRTTINKLYKNVEWDWFKNGSNTLYWHWSPNYGWDSYMQINGWDEALITYIMAAASPTHTIDSFVYKNGWARNGAIKNGNSYYGYVLPLGEAKGGPLFFEHYTFLGVDPNGLVDQYANYQTQTTNHALINYSYCVANPSRYNGYSDSCWGLTASDDNIGGYSAHSPTNDLGIISPTAALSSFPYTPAQSMAALHFFYYKLGDKIWGFNGFTDAFNLTNPWFATSTLAIDQGPIIDMIENYRTGLLWNLFMSCPEVKTGMQKLGFSSPHF